DRSPRPAAFHERLDEANRLASRGDVAGTAALLDELSGADELTAQELGWLEGIRAYAFQSAGRHDEADEAYRRAILQFERAGDAEAAHQAGTQRASSLRQLGRLDAAEEVLRTAVARAPSAEHADRARLVLANTLRDRHARNADPELLDEASALL